MPLNIFLAVFLTAIASPVTSADSDAQGYVPLEEAIEKIEHYTDIVENAAGRKKAQQAETMEEKVILYLKEHAEQIKDGQGLQNQYLQAYRQTMVQIAQWMNEYQKRLKKGPISPSEKEELRETFRTFLQRQESLMGPLLGEAFKTALAHHPEDVPRQYRGGYVDDVSRDHPGESWPQTTLGQVQLREGQSSEAFESFTEALSVNPADVEAWAGRADAQFELGHYQNAQEDARNALKIDPSNQQALAIFHFSEGRIDGVVAQEPRPQPVQSQAIAPAEGGLRAQGLPKTESFPKAASKEVQGPKKRDLGAAAPAANRALVQSTKDLMLLNLSASIDARRGHYAQAIEESEVGLSLAPRNVSLLRTLAFAQVRSKNDKGALASANRLLELEPNDAMARALRAHAYGGMGDREGMLADLRRAAALDPRFAPILTRLSSQAGLPQDKDALFLFPGEGVPTFVPPPAVGRGYRFWFLVVASILGGTFLAVGFLRRPTLAVAEAGSQPALVLGRYEISHQIGTGGMGMVFAGTDRSLGRPVAIKKMREELRRAPRERARFIAEAKMVAGLRHPNIVDIYAIVEDAEDVFLVFEYVDGKTAHELIQAGSRLPADHVVHIVRCSAAALEHAHSHGVIHRDVKPSNIMIDAGGRVKVMDFGIARMVEDAMGRESLTNTIVGTPSYMAPEQERGEVRRESDVYALAVCAYEMLAGNLPFAGSGAGVLLNKINMSYVAPSRAIAGLPEALDEVFAKAFGADPNKRYRSPKDFAEAFGGALGLASQSLDQS